MKLTRRAFSLFAASLITTALFAALGCDSPKPDANASSGAPTGEATAASGTGTPKELVIGFTPAAEASKVIDSAKPLAAFLSKELGIPVTSFISTDYTGLVEAMGSGKVDIGMLPPLAYVLANDQKYAEVQFKVLRKDKKTGKPALTYKAMFVAKADSGIKKIEDAKGKRIAFVDPSSASGYLFPAADLKQKGLDPDKFFVNSTFAGSHDNAVLLVYRGGVDVAACYDDARTLLEKNGIKDVKQKVSVIGYTGEIPNDTISFRNGFDPAFSEKLKAAIKKYSETEDGKKVLYDLYEADGLVEAKDSDYDSVREVAKAMDVQLTMFTKKDKAKTAPTPAASPSAAAK